eukprot:gnl/Dysnectes_brevis/3403_a4285_752.p1 GENE.gnl/Dysnectes_brevis/3403_a4285_752~~gnl/Dysnectes_brevis/3403_a4285_752.p1  ORF type:complete len:442 (+),score=149.33 gnl/Dysnectes_brevis/3403_a4285_752:16-1341(+)
MWESKPSHILDQTISLKYPAMSQKKEIISPDIAETVFVEPDDSSKTHTFLRPIENHLIASGWLLLKAVRDKQPKTVIKMLSRFNNKELLHLSFWWTPKTDPEEETARTTKINTVLGGAIIIPAQSIIEIIRGSKLKSSFISFVIGLLTPKPSYITTLLAEATALKHTAMQTYVDLICPMPRRILLQVQEVFLERYGKSVLAHLRVQYQDTRPSFWLVLDTVFRYRSMEVPRLAEMLRRVEQAHKYISAFSACRGAQGRIDLKGKDRPGKHAPADPSSLLPASARSLILLLGSQSLACMHVMARLYYQLTGAVLSDELQAVFKGWTLKALQAVVNAGGGLAVSAAHILEDAALTAQTARCVVASTVYYDLSPPVVREDDESTGDHRFLNAIPEAYSTEFCQELDGRLGRFSRHVKGGIAAMTRYVPLTVNEDQTCYVLERQD